MHCCSNLNSGIRYFLWKTLRLHVNCVVRKPSLSMFLSHNSFTYLIFWTQNFQNNLSLSCISIWKAHHFIKSKIMLMQSYQFINFNIVVFEVSITMWQVSCIRTKFGLYHYIDGIRANILIVLLEWIALVYSKVSLW